MKVTYSYEKLNSRVSDKLLPYSYNQPGIVYSDRKLGMYVPLENGGAEFYMNKKDSNYILTVNSKEKKKKYYCGFHIESDEIFLKSYLVDFGGKTNFRNAIKFLFKTFKVKRVHCDMALYNFSNNLRKDCNRMIELPNTYEKLLERESKKSRYNFKRERRILFDMGYQFCELEKAQWNNALKVFFNYKLQVYNRNWQLTPEQFIDWLNITNIYALKNDKNEYISFVLSDENFPMVGYRNCAYNPQFSKYSPGKVLYLCYLECLIQKGIAKQVQLGGGGV